MLLPANNAPLVLHQILPGQSTGGLFRSPVPYACLGADSSLSGGSCCHSTLLAIFCCVCSWSWFSSASFVFVYDVLPQVEQELVAMLQELKMAMLEEN